MQLFPEKPAGFRQLGQILLAMLILFTAVGVGATYAAVPALYRLRIAQSRVAAYRAFNAAEAGVAAAISALASGNSGLVHQGELDQANYRVECSQGKRKDEWVLRSSGYSGKAVRTVVAVVRVREERGNRWSVRLLSWNEE